MKFLMEYNALTGDPITLAVRPQWFNHTATWINKLAELWWTCVQVALQPSYNVTWLNLGSFRCPHTGDWGSPDITLANSFLFCTLKMVESRPGNSQRTAKSGSQRSRYRQHCQAQRSRKHIDLLLTPSTIVQDLEITQRTIKGKKNLKKQPWTQLKW